MKFKKLALKAIEKFWPADHYPEINLQGRKVIFIHINKTGGTSVLNALGFKSKIHTTARQVIDQTSKEYWDQAFKFAFVRNPWDKVASHYRYRLKKNSQNLQSGSPDFEDWVKKTYGEQKDFHYYDLTMMFQPQLDWLIDHNGELAVDFIGRFENLQADFEKLNQQLGTQSKLAHLNATSAKDYRSYYDDTSREIVANWFARDIEYFGYRF